MNIANLHIINSDTIFYYNGNKYYYIYSSNDNHGYTMKINNLENDKMETSYKDFIRVSDAIKYIEQEEEKVIMTKERLEKNYIVSSYNEDTPEQMDYYINENSCEKGDIGFLYSYEEDNEEDRIQALEIVKIIKRSDNLSKYDKLIEDNDILLNGEDLYAADTSAEFITDNDCYLVWFKYLDMEG